MRYLIISYQQVMQGKGDKKAQQTDEIVSVSKSLKLKDLQTAAVILDFQKQKVEKSSLNGVTVPKNWQSIRDFYYQHYSKIIDDLERIWGPQTLPASQVTDTASEPQ